MTEQTQSLEAIRDIKKMMERSSRFISLSGLSGIAAGICALAGAWYATGIMHKYYPAGRSYHYNAEEILMAQTSNSLLIDKLFLLAIGTFICAFVLAFFFTYIQSKKNNIPLWGGAAKRLMWNTAIPLLVGGVFVLAMIQNKYLNLVAPACLIFYGLALVNGSKYTLGEVRYLGYGQLVLGIINLWCIGYGLYFWAAGFGVLHIIYGAIMWWKYDRA